MAGRRPLSHSEERQLLRVVRELEPRDRALVTAQWMTGFRISEILSLTVGTVLRDEMVVDKIGIAPRHLKGKRGTTRWVPVLAPDGGAMIAWFQVLLLIGACLFVWAAVSRWACPFED